MSIKTAQFKIQGMNQDNSESAFPEKFAFEIMNMRIDARQDNTLLSLTNEKGNHEMYKDDYSPILGSPIGYAVINDFLILFAHNPNTQLDYIYKIETNGFRIIETVVFEGDLDFKENWKQRKPLETLAWYESDTIQKVYWIDGLHQPRMVNIANDDAFPITSSELYDGFDFNRKLELEEHVEIQQGHSGQFHSGIAQYFITYYDKNGSESNIAWQSPLMYVTYDDRGGSPEDIVPKSFTLTITGIDQNYDYMRVYCVQRTTLDGEVFVRRVQDFPKGENQVVFTDNGILGESVDSSYLIYVGGDELVAGCFTQKDQVLFLGDIEASDTYVDGSGMKNTTITISHKTVPNNTGNAQGKYYHYFHQELLQGYEENNDQQTQGNSTISTFKYLETYRFGIQFQFDNGKWSNVIHVGDKEIDWRIHTVDGHKAFAMPVIDVVKSELPDNQRIRKIRPVCVFPSVFERNVICQGILCPTVYNVSDRVTGKTFSYGSWFSRPFAPSDLNKVYDRTDPSNPVIVYPTRHNGECEINNNGTWESYDNTNYPLNPYAIRTSANKDLGCWAEFRHNEGIPGPQSFNGEIQMQYRESGGMIYPLFPAKSPSSDTEDLNTPYEFNNCYSNGFNIDQSIVTLHSPDIEFNESIANVALKNAKLRIIGFVPVAANSGDIYIDATIPENYKWHKWQVKDGITELTEELPSSFRPVGFYNEKVGVKINSKYGWFNLINGPYWQDKLYNPSFNYNWDDEVDHSNNEYTFTAITVPEWIRFGFVIYPWQQHGSLSNGNPEDNYSILKTKILSNIKYSLDTKYFTRDLEGYPNDGYWTSCNGIYDGNDTGLSDAVYIDSENDFTLLHSPYGDGQISYDGNMDKILAYNKNDWSPRMAVFKTRAYDHYGVISHYYLMTDYEWWPPDQGDEMPYYRTANDLIPTNPDDQRYTIPDYYRTYNDEDYFIYGDGWTSDWQEELDTDGLQYYYHPIESRYLINWVRELGHSTHYAMYYANSIKQPISIRYKCSPHIVLALNNQTDYTDLYDNVHHNIQRCLPVPSREVGVYSVPINPISSEAGSVNGTTIFKDFGSKKLYFDPDYSSSNDRMHGCIQSFLPQADFSNENHGGYWLAELYRDDDDSNKFGGTSPEALANNIWCVCGEAVDVTQEGETISLNCTEGDTFYQRYDHLKTLPYSESDENQVIEIVSFMCESRINLDGRYDRQRGLDNCQYLLPEMFNQTNKVYSQTDNYLPQSYVIEDRPSTHHPNAIIWSGKKVNGEDVDIWTQLHTENFLDLEGYNGKINALKTFRNEIYAFQDSAIAQILYNSRTALATTEGSPVQLASSGLVEGKQYLTNSMGCLNKWSICETPLGLTFNDDLNKAMMLMGDGFQNLSEKFGMSTWMFDNCSTKPWDLDFSNMVVYYDKYNKDILYVTSDNALAYSTKLGNFTSFYGYGGTPFIVNYKDRVLDIRGNIDTSSQNHYTELWAQNMGSYNMYYGVFQPFYVTFIVNANPTTDKIFNTVEYRADSFDIYDNYEAGVTFDIIRAWNEYQDTLEQPVGNISTILPSDIKKKFRMWRLNVPRDNGGMDRIRNPWTYIQLKKSDNQYISKLQLHDVQIHYTE